MAMTLKILGKCRWIGLIALFSSAVFGAPLQLVFHDFAPFSYQDSQGTNQGILIDLANRVCQDWPDSCDVQLRPFRRARQMFAHGEAQGIFFGWNGERAKTMWFSLPLVETEYGFYSQQQDKFTDLTQLSGVTVGVYGQSNTFESLMKLQNQLLQDKLAPIDIVIYPQANQLPLRMLQKQRATAYYVNKDVGAFYAKQIGLSSLNYLSADRHILYCVAFNMQYTSEATVRKFNHLLSNLLTQHKLDDIYAKWQMAPATLATQYYPEMSMPF